MRDETFIDDSGAQVLECKICGAQFDFSTKQQLFAALNFEPPFRCVPCRREAKAKREAEQMKKLREQEPRTTIGDILRKHLGGNA